MPATTMTSRTLEVPGGSIYYEVRGEGPVLCLMPGGPADATTFRRMEDRLAAAYTVVTYDPRGLSHSSDFDPADDGRMVEIFADDVHRLLDAVGAGKASILGSSGGAVIALELAIRHPEQLDTVVSHEPPSPVFLPDTDRVRAAMESVCDAYASGGIGAAMAIFGPLAGIQGGPPPEPEGGEPSPDVMQAMALMQRNMEFFFSRYVRNLARYTPDVAALRATSCRVVAAVGADSKGQLAHNGGLGLADALGTPAAVFPGEHGGFDSHPAEFADKLCEVLRG